MNNGLTLDPQVQELQQLGFEILRTEPLILIAKRRTFYWECFLTFVNYTMFVRRVERLSAAMILEEREKFLNQSKALNRSKLPRGIQSGNAILVAYIADRVDEDAQRLCEYNSKKYFAQFYQTAALNTQTSQTYLLKKTPLWGAVYFGKFTYLLNRVLLPQVQTHQEPLSTLGIVLTTLFVGWFLLILLLMIVLVILT